MVAGHYRPLPLFPDSFVVRVGGSVVLFAIFGGVLLFALQSFRAHNTTVNPYGKPTTLITSGVFRYSRNPIYVGLLFVPLALAVALNSIWLVGAAALLFLLLHFGVVRPEERLLVTQFGDSYRTYFKRVRRWL